MRGATRALRVRVGLISDIHGNRLALDGVLAGLEREEVDQIVCLGDVAVAPQPGEALEKVETVYSMTRLGRVDKGSTAEGGSRRRGILLRADDGARTHDLLHGKEPARGDSDCQRTTNGPATRVVGAANRHET